MRYNLANNPKPLPPLRKGLAKQCLEQNANEPQCLLYTHIEMTLGKHAEQACSAGAPRGGGDLEMWCSCPAAQARSG